MDEGDGDESGCGRREAMMGCLAEDRQWWRPEAVARDSGQRQWQQRRGNNGCGRKEVMVGGPALKTPKFQMTLT